MKRIILWGLLMFSMFTLNVSAKENYIVQFDLVNMSEDLKTNLAFYTKSDVGGRYEAFEDGYYLLNGVKSESFSNRNTMTFVIPEEFINAKFQFIIEDQEGRYKTDPFICKYIKDREGNNVCYNEYDYEARLIKTFTNLHIVYNTLNLVKDDWIALAIVTIILIVLAVLYNIVMQSKGIKKNLINNDIFYIIFNIAIIILAYALYVINFFNSYNVLVLISMFLAVYYFIYYISKFLAAKKVGGWTLLYAMLAYFIALGSSVLVFSYFV